MAQEFSDPPGLVVVVHEQSLIGAMTGGALAFLLGDHGLESVSREAVLPEQVIAP